VGIFGGIMVDLSNKNTKKTPFYDIHKELNAKIIPFAGYLMPVMYDSITAEHKRVRTTVGLFDLSHMGEFEITGAGAKDFIQHLVTNDLDRLIENQVMYTCMCYENGGIVDDLLVYNLKDRFLLVVNAANINKDFAHIQKHLPNGIKLTNSSDETALLAIQGPLASDVLAKLTDYPLDNLKYYHADYVTVAGNRILLSRTGYTGEDGFELYFSKKLAEKMWEPIFKVVKQKGGGAIGLGARDSLRLEMKFALYGNDISENTNPLEAGLGWVVKFSKGDFIGSEALLKVKKEGIKRKLIGFEVEGNVFPRQHYPIIHDRVKVGEVTSGMFSPLLRKGIGMGYLPLELSNPGTHIEIEVRGQKHPATVVKTPFYKKGSHK